jgi:hypothetical protein
MSQAEDVIEIVDENRETIELVAEGDDEAARMAQDILDRAGGDDGE